MGRAKGTVSRLRKTGKISPALAPTKAETNNKSQIVWPAVNRYRHPIYKVSEFERNELMNILANPDVPEEDKEILRELIYKVTPVERKKLDEITEGWEPYMIDILLKNSIFNNSDYRVEHGNPITFNPAGSITPEL